MVSEVEALPAGSASGNDSVVEPGRRGEAAISGGRVSEVSELTSEAPGRVADSGRVVSDGSDAAASLGSGAAGATAESVESVIPADATSLPGAAAPSEMSGMARILRTPSFRSTWTVTDPEGEAYGNSCCPSSPTAGARWLGTISRSSTSICWRVATSAETGRRLLPMARVTFSPVARTSSSARYL